MKNKVLGATVWTGVDGFGKRRRSTVTIEGITINMPLVIEVIDERSKLEPLLPELKMMVNDNGSVTIHEVDVNLIWYFYKNFSKSIVSTSPSPLTSIITD